MLVDEVVAGLEAVEASALDGPHLAASLSPMYPNETRLSGVANSCERLNDLASLEHLQGTRVELYTRSTWSV
jgi:hypothetical protein